MYRQKSICYQTNTGVQLMIFTIFIIGNKNYKKKRIRITVEF